MKRCPHCGGAGEIELTRFASSSPFDERAECPTCHGEAVVPDHHRRSRERERQRESQLDYQRFHKRKR